MARSMLKASGLSNEFWAEAVATSIYLLNISPTRAVMNQTPYEAWCGRRPSIVIRRDVVFDENTSWKWSEDQVQHNILAPLAAEIFANEEHEPTLSSSTTTPSTSTSTPSRNSSTTLEESSDETPPARYRSLTDIYASCQFALTVSDPINYGEAAEKEEWRKAMEEEMKAIEKNETWEITDLPEGKNAIGLKWVFKTKFAADGSILKHKARLVAKGYAQQYGIDFEETFSPVARFETVRLILALAAQLQWMVYQFDVKSAFLNGELHEEVYVAQPEGFEKGNETKVYKLRKALYGLKQAPRAWYSKIDGYLQKNGYTRSENEPTLYAKRKVNRFHHYLPLC
ncbi:hypothetical protein Scep_018764 [Stephania cephalantha]|uniref:Reverse transcriptase Ty1/copia-type domain-containing protein n=1 Tax=Stephania cephalantha TaxID=152367 RepID=A0AAP0I9P2_9MAGN